MRKFPLLVAVQFVLVMAAFCFPSPSIGAGSSGGLSPSKVDIYFHGNSSPYKLRDNLGHAIISYDGKQFFDRGFTKRSGFGGFTVTDVAKHGNISVKLYIFTPDKVCLGVQSWNKSFGDGEHGFALHAGGSEFNMTMKRNGTKVLVTFN